MSKARVMESPAEAMELGSGGGAPAADIGTNPQATTRIPIDRRSLSFMRTPFIDPNDDGAIMARPSTSCNLGSIGPEPRIRL
jgi:hypothetical protein